MLMRGAGRTACAPLAPWILFGYTDTLKESWNNDRQDLIAYVDQRRNETVQAAR